MNSRLILCAYKRPELLARVLNSLWRQREHLPQIHIIDDGGQDAEVARLIQVAQGCWPWDRVIVERRGRNAGLAALTNYALGRAFLDGCDTAAVIDADTVVEPADWLPRMHRFLVEHPEIGWLSPDKPGCYLRIKRPTYDEVEWAVGICYMTSRRAYLDMMHEDSCWYDEDLATSWEPDAAYRLRMLGYRVAVLPGTQVVDMGEGQSTIPGRLGVGNTNFNLKWNRRLLGRAVAYKSPLMLRWEDLPLNRQFRLLLNAQAGSMYVTEANPQLCGHKADRVSYLATSGTTPAPERLRQWLDEDIWLDREVPVDPELMAGRRPFDWEKDVAPFSLARRRAEVNTDARTKENGLEEATA